jgi:hypothetical protein
MVSGRLAVILFHEDSLGFPSHLEQFISMVGVMGD